MNNNTNTNTNPNEVTITRGPGRACVRRAGSMRLLVAGAAIALVSVAGCSTAQRRAFGEQDVRDALASQVKAAADHQSLTLNGSVECTAKIDAASTLSASCVGTSTSGRAVIARFTGTADVDAETCTAMLVVDVDGVGVVEQPGVHCFDSV